MKKNSLKLTYLVLLMMTMGLMLVGCAKSQNNSTEATGIFSWKSEALTDDNMVNILKELNVNQVYQFLSRSDSNQDIAQFVNNMGQAGIVTYALYGEREWALDPTGSKMCEMIERTNAINAELGEHKLKGIVFDVEPYLLDEWKSKSSSVMASYVKAAKAAYENRGDLEIMLCIPYHFDSKGLEKELEQLVAECCDGILVMNYYRDKEEKHISDEADICKKYNKKIYTIYEMRPNDDMTTYYNLGVKAAYDNYVSLRESLGNKDLGIAYHDYKTIKGVLEGE